jgi:S1-C subfamily serine protease
MKNYKTVLLAGLLAIAANGAVAQTEAPQEPSSESSLLASINPAQRRIVEAVYLIECGDRHGTGFLIESGSIVTNAHVVEGCDKSSIVAKQSSGKIVSLKNLVVDDRRDLALLQPEMQLSGGLSLGEDQDLKVGMGLTTWGFPLIYSSGVPLLTVGYLSGYNVDAGTVDHVKHLVVNGAFNPGNSGGPVLLANGTKVVGVVVWKQRLTSRNVPIAIEGLKHSATRSGGTFSKVLPNGQTEQLSNEEVIAAVLEEFYNLVQVQIGEAIAVSELKAFLAENKVKLK